MVPNNVEIRVVAELIKRMRNCIKEGERQLLYKRDIIARKPVNYWI